MGREPLKPYCPEELLWDKKARVSYGAPSAVERERALQVFF